MSRPESVRLTSLHVRVLFGTPVPGAILLADSTVWFEDTVSEREFSHQAPTTGTTGFVLSVPVVAPTLFDVILTNNSAADKPTVYRGAAGSGHLG